MKPLAPFHGLTFLPSVRVVMYQQSWADLYRTSPDLCQPQGSYCSFPPGAVRPVYVLPGWIPFAYDHGGNHLGIDLDPAPAGTPGQVINFGQDERDHYVLGGTLRAYLTWLVDALKGGNFKIEDEDEGGRSLNTRFPDSHHFLDGLAELFGTQQK